MINHPLANHICLATILLHIPNSLHETEAPILRLPRESPAPWRAASHQCCLGNQEMDAEMMVNWLLNGN